MNLFKLVWVGFLSVGLFACQITNKQAEHPKLSVQLWSVNQALKKDFKGTLQQISAMGFKHVEFARDFGPYAKDPKGLKKLLDSLDLTVSSGHVHLHHFNDKKFAETVEYYQTLGTNLLIVPNDMRSDKADKIKGLVDDLNAMQVKLAQHGMRLGYHNHVKEFADFNGSTFWDYIAQNTHSDVVLQLDVGHATTGGKNPIEYIKRYPNRTISTHLKPKVLGNVEGKRNIIGEDQIDWTGVLSATLSHGGTEWWVIEHDASPKELATLEAVALSKQNLTKIINTLPIKTQE